MVYVIAILLALILVALVSSNSSSANAVSKVLRICLVTSLVALIWIVWIGYLTWYFVNSEEQSWYEIITLAIGIFLPAAILWINKEGVKEFFKSDNKKIFKTLALTLFGVLVFAIFGIFIQDVKKDNPHILFYLNIAGLLATGFYLNSLRSSKNLSFKEAFSFPKEPWEIAQIEFDEWYEKYTKDRDFLFESDEYQKFSDAKKDEIYDELMKDYDSAIEKKFNRTEEIKKNPKRNEYVVMSFWLFVFFLIIQFIGFSYNVAHDFVMTLDFIKGRSWLANIIVIASPFLILGLILGISDDVKEVRNRKK